MGISKCFWWGPLNLIGTILEPTLCSHVSSRLLKAENSRRASLEDFKMRTFPEKEFFKRRKYRMQFKYMYVPVANENALDSSVCDPSGENEPSIITLSESVIFACVDWCGWRLTSERRLMASLASEIPIRRPPKRFLIIYSSSVSILTSSGRKSKKLA